MSKEPYKPKTNSPLEAAYAAAMNARDHAENRFQAMDFAHEALRHLDSCSLSDSGLVRGGPLAEAKKKWDI